MSSHREAPQISKDPVADSTDVYAFVSPDDPSTVTLIANYIPLEPPDSGPNFYEFDDTVLYAINVDNNGDGIADVAFLFTFNTTLRDPSFFLYNIGPITSLSSPNWNRVQTYSLEMVDWHHGRATQLGTGLPCPPCNVGPLSTPGYANLAADAISTFGNGIKSFAGQRAEGFYVDLGAVFDLGNLRPFQGDHAGWASTGLPAMAAGVNSTAGVNVHTLAVQVPMNLLTSNGQAPTSSTGTIGVWTTASRQQIRILEGGPAWRQRPGLEPRPLRPGLAPGQPAVQRGARSAVDQGLLELAVARQGLPVRRVRLEPTAGRPAARPVSRPASSTTWPPSTPPRPPGRTSWPFCSPASPAAWCRASPATTPAPLRRTCCGST